MPTFTMQNNKINNLQTIMNNQTLHLNNLNMYYNSYIDSVYDYILCQIKISIINRLTELRNDNCPEEND